MTAGAAYFRLLIDEPLPGTRNMAVDEALMRGARTARAGEGEAGSGNVTLRFYRWEPGCLSFGRNQAARDAYDPAAAAARGIDVVRRPTGGRSVYHHRELTYSVTALAGTWGSLRDTYCRINRALAAGLAELGVPVQCAAEAPGSGRAPRPIDRACFRDPLPGEVTARGRKLVGSAQWRDGGALLQHGSLLLVDEQGVAEELRKGTSGRPRSAGRSSPTSTGAIALDELLGAAPSCEDLVEALVAGFGREFGMTPRADELTAGERSLVRELEARYADPEWTWRR